MADKNEIQSTHATPPQAKTSSPEKLPEAGKTGDKELVDDELKGVAGGKARFVDDDLHL